MRFFEIEGDVLFYLAGEVAQGVFAGVLFGDAVGEFAGQYVEAGG